MVTWRYQRLDKHRMVPTFIINTKMKKIALSFLIAVSNITVWSQSIIPINYEFDYSRMTINKMEAIGYIAANESNDNETPEEAFRRFTKKTDIAFVSIVNGKVLLDKGYKLDNQEKSQYKVKIYFKNVDKDGEHTIYAEVYDNNTNTMIRSFSAHAGGGSWGTFLHLFYERMEKSGKQFGKKLLAK